MNHGFVLRFLPFSLLLFELARFTARVSADELKVPYVPYVVVDKNKDEFDYDRLQDVIVKYLENQSRHKPFVTSTTLYDFLRTSTDEQTTQRPADTRSLNVYPLNFPLNTNSFLPTVFKPAVRIKDKTEVTAHFKPTTFQPHRVYTTPVPFINASSVFRNGNFAMQYPFLQQPPPPKFIPLKFSPPPLPDGTRENIPKAEEYFNSLATLNLATDDMKCSLRSSRHVYDGGCVSKKPVVETVCADRCIKYERSPTKQFIGAISSKTEMERFSNKNESRKPVMALTCKDGDVRKQKVKLYCKDGTIINNVIRIVDNCICQQHREKVHTTKRRQNQANNVRKRKIRRTPILLGMRTGS